MLATFTVTDSAQYANEVVVTCNGCHQSITTLPKYVDESQLGHRCAL